MIHHKTSIVNVSPLSYKRQNFCYRRFAYYNVYATLEYYLRLLHNSGKLHIKIEDLPLLCVMRNFYIRSYNFQYIIGAYQLRCLFKRHNFLMHQQYYKVYVIKVWNNTPEPTLQTPAQSHDLILGIIILPRQSTPLREQ